MNIEKDGRFIVTCEQLQTLTRLSFISGLVSAEPKMPKDNVRQHLKEQASHLSNVMRDAIGAEE